VLGYALARARVTARALFLACRPRVKSLGNAAPAFTVALKTRSMSRLRISTAGSAEEGGAAVARGREAGGAPGRAAVSGTPGGTRAVPTMDCRTPPGCGQTGGRRRRRTPAAETDFPLEGAARLAAAAAVFAARLVLVERAATRRAHRCRLLRRKPDSGQRGHQRRGPYFAAPRPRAAPSRLPHRLPGIAICRAGGRLLLPSRGAIWPPRPGVCSAIWSPRPGTRVPLMMLCLLLLHRHVGPSIM